MVSVLIAILIIVLVAAVFGGLIQYAPFIPPPLKQWALYAVGAVAIVLIVIQLISLLNGVR